MGRSRSRRSRCRASSTRSTRATTRSRRGRGSARVRAIARSTPRSARSVRSSRTRTCVTSRTRASGSSRQTRTPTSSIRSYDSDGNRIPVPGPGNAALEQGARSRPPGDARGQGRSPRSPRSPRVTDPAGRSVLSRGAEQRRDLRAPCSSRRDPSFGDAGQHAHRDVVHRETRRARLRGDHGRRGALAVHRCRWGRPARRR